MTGYLLSPATQNDVNGIWEYSVETWGIEQATSYIGNIRDTLDGLADGTRISRPVSVRDGYRKILAGSHVVYFRVTDTGLIIVVRILHQRMDVERHLK